MLRHVILLRFKPDRDPELVERIRARLDALPKAIPQVRELRHGSDAGLSSGRFDYAIVVDFDSEADYRAYLEHPAHRELGALVMQIVAEPAQIQFHC
ncbi:MAG: hypothetical protein KatS3mg124_0060 [Porticoccaceae bacterium]|nr:MAG: hypothetical protein KatS3mg124_0060 [Porticoccaceae bacterium]